MPTLGLAVNTVPNPQQQQQQQQSVRPQQPPQRQLCSALLSADALPGPMSPATAAGTSEQGPMHALRVGSPLGAGQGRVPSTDALRQGGCLSVDAVAGMPPVGPGAPLALPCSSFLSPSASSSTNTYCVLLSGSLLTLLSGSCGSGSSSRSSVTSRSSACDGSSRGSVSSSGGLFGRRSMAPSAATGHMAPVRFPQQPATSDVGWTSSFDVDPQCLQALSIRANGGTLPLSASAVVYTGENATGAQQLPTSCEAAQNAPAYSCSVCGVLPSSSAPVKPCCSATAAAAALIHQQPQQWDCRCGKQPGACAAATHRPHTGSRVTVAVIPYVATRAYQAAMAGRSSFQAPSAVAADTCSISDPTGWQLQAAALQQLPCSCPAASSQASCMVNPGQTCGLPALVSAKPAAQQWGAQQPSAPAPAARCSAAAPPAACGTRAPATGCWQQLPVSSPFTVPPAACCAQVALPVCWEQLPATLPFAAAPANGCATAPAAAGGTAAASQPVCWEQLPTSAPFVVPPATGCAAAPPAASCPGALPQPACWQLLLPSGKGDPLPPTLPFAGKDAAAIQAAAIADCALFNQVALSAGGHAPQGPLGTLAPGATPAQVTAAFPAEPCSCFGGPSLASAPFAGAALGCAGTGCRPEAGAFCTC